MFLSDIVAPDSIIARSVNIERDLGDRATLKQYILSVDELLIFSKCFRHVARKAKREERS